MYKVYLINKVTNKRESVVFEHEKEEAAEEFCEAWGWNYCDGVRSFWLELAKE